MNGNPLKIMIIGAGTGGLCLAQGLKSNRMDVEVFEREPSPTDRLQGYRLSINTTGNSALRSCLPAQLYTEFLHSAAAPSKSVTFLDHKMNQLLGLDLSLTSRSVSEREVPVSRIALRKVLIRGLGSVVQFGKKLVRFDDLPDGRVIARFEDGSTATGDLLIGADGASSQVRRQLLPQAKRIETGIIAVSGKLDLNDAVRASIPKPILQGPTMVLGPRGCFLFANAVTYDSRNPHPAKAGAGEQDYVMWGFSAHRGAFDLPAPIETLCDAEAKAAVLDLMQDWNPALRHLIKSADESTMTTFPVKTSVPIPPWPTRHVTLLGDALHNMTPFRGIGANTALRDAEALRKALVTVDRGDDALLVALARYEREMIDYGFRAVQSSLKNMERFHATGRFSRMLTKTLFRAVDHLSPLKSAFLGR
jgi:2-polyprenyl-6-methoxyphenol hydroxylase-like FAD-dependent oxidoreductase